MAEMPSEPVPRPRSILCPYCGDVSSQTKRCASCGGLFEPLSRQATQNAMGPWFIRDTSQPFRPGCSYETLLSLIRAGKVGPTAVIRGPTTRQFWTLARRAPGIAHLFGSCHSCQAEVSASLRECPNCGASFVHAPDRQRLGLGPVRLLPGQAAPEAVAMGAGRSSAHPPTQTRVAADPASAPPATGDSGPRSMLLPIVLIAGATIAAAGGALWFMQSMMQQEETFVAAPAAEGFVPAPVTPDLEPEYQEPLSTPPAAASEEVADAADVASPAPRSIGADVVAARALLRSGRIEEARQALDALPDGERSQLQDALEMIDAVHRLQKLP